MQSKSNWTLKHFKAMQIFPEGVLVRGQTDCIARPLQYKNFQKIQKAKFPNRPLRTFLFVQVPLCEAAPACPPPFSPATPLFPPSLPSLPLLLESWLLPLASSCLRSTIWLSHLFQFSPPIGSLLSLTSFRYLT